MRRKDIQVARAGNEIILASTASWPKMMIRHRLSMHEALALGEVLVQFSQEIAQEAEFKRRGENALG